MTSVAIVGTGLIGASFGLALRQAGFEGPIAGVSSPRAIADAIAVGAIDRGAPLAEAVAQADLVFLSQTIGRILDTIRHLDPLVRPEALVTDAGSTKCESSTWRGKTSPAASSWAATPWPAKRSAGRRKRTPVFSRPHLGADAGFAVRAGHAGGPRLALVARAHRRAHRDPRCGGTRPRGGAHLAPSATGIHGAGRHRGGAHGRLPALADGGPRPGRHDPSRAGSYDLWRDILATNTEHIERALAVYIQKLEHMRENLRTRQLQEEFDAAPAWRAASADPVSCRGRACPPLRC